MKKFIFIAFLGVLNACAFIPDYSSDIPLDRNYVKLNKTYTTSIYPQDFYLGERMILKKNYTLKKREYIRPGDRIIRVESYRQKEFEHNSFVLPYDVEMRFVVGKFKFPAGTYRVIGTTIIDGEKLLVLESKYKYFLLMRENYTLCDFSLYEKEKGSGIYIRPNEQITFYPKNPRLTKKSSVRRDEVPVDEYEVVYDGVKDNKMIFFYKKPVFGTDGSTGIFETITFHADEPVIKILGVTIQVIRADADHLEYVVLKDS